MRCCYCSSNQSSVIDKREVKSTGEIRRRRECLKCHKRYTTYEKACQLEVYVVKRDGRRELFSRDKLKVGIERSLEKRPAMEQVEEIVDRIEGKVITKGLKEVESKLIGKLVLSELKKLDPVAYLRFVSVYRQFSDAEDFYKEMEHLKVN